MNSMCEVTPWKLGSFQPLEILAERSPQCTDRERNQPAEKGTRSVTQEQIHHDERHGNANPRFEDRSRGADKACKQARREQSKDEYEQCQSWVCGVRSRHRANDSTENYKQEHRSDGDGHGKSGPFPLKANGGGCAAGTEFGTAMITELAFANWFRTTRAGLC